MPAVRLFSVIFIEFVRGVPLITVLFMASVMLPLFVPDAWSPDKLLRALIGIALFASAYMAEVVRAGLQAIPKGQYEGAMALGLGYWQMMRLDHPAAGAEDHHPEHRQHLSSACSRTRRWSSSSASSISCAPSRPRASIRNGRRRTTSTTGYAFAAIFYFVFCYGMSRYARERRERGSRRGDRR